MLSDIRVKEARVSFSDEKIRTPLKFGKVVIETITYAAATVTVENRSGKSAQGHGGIFLSDGWAFPTAAVSHEAKDQAMREVTEGFAAVLAEARDFQHPVELYLAVEPEIKRLCREISAKRGFAEPLPFLAGLVCASPADAAVHDAFGNVNDICSYDGYGREYMKDLGYFLGDRLKGKYIGDYLRREYLQKIPVFHLVGGLDKLRENEITDTDPKDGLPVSLEKWIEREHLFCLKVKLRGNDLDWDVARTVAVSEVAHAVYRRLNMQPEIYLSVDTNEVCAAPEYIVEMLGRIREKDKQAFREILYVEQPTGRDLEQAGFDMDSIGRIRPVLVDESLTGIADFYRARDLRWSGLALKTCKCHSAELLFAALAGYFRMPYTVQDLTNPKISLIHSAGFAARTYTLKGVESNAGQYFPLISQAEARVHPGIFSRQGGVLRLDTLGKTGLGYRMEEIENAKGKM